MRNEEKEAKDEGEEESQEGGTQAGAPSPVGQLEAEGPVAVVLPGSRWPRAAVSPGSPLLSHVRRSQHVRRKHSFRSCPPRTSGRCE